MRLHLHLLLDLQPVGFPSSVLIFNFFFTYPYFTLLSDPATSPPFGVMFLVDLQQYPDHPGKAAGRPKRLESLPDPDLAGDQPKLQKAEQQEEIPLGHRHPADQLLERPVLLYPAERDGDLHEPMVFPCKPRGFPGLCLTPAEQAVAKWVLINNKHAGATTGTLPSAQCLYMAVRGSGLVLAVAGIAIERKPRRNPLKT